MVPDLKTKFHSLQGASKATVFAAYLAIAGYAIAVLNGLSRPLASGYAFYEFELLRNLALVILEVTFVIWYWKATINQFRLLKGNDATDGQARWYTCKKMLGWVIPFVNIFLPFVLMRELWRSSDMKVKTEEDLIWIEQSPKDIGIWWGAYLIGGALHGTIRLIPAEMRMPGEILSALLLVLALFWLGKIVRGISARQTQKIHTLTHHQQDVASVETPQIVQTRLQPTDEGGTIKVEQTEKQRQNAE